MRYIDSGLRDPSQTIFEWFKTCPAAEVRALRWQTGYFSIDGIGALLSIVEQLAKSDMLTRGVIGSNDQETQQVDLEMLLGFMGSGSVRSSVYDPAGPC